MKTSTAKFILLSYAKEAISQASLNQGQISSLPISLPPIEEQHRALCDTLKAHLQDTQTTQTQLADAIVEQTVA
ncbi:hypothetical protein MNBD_GAMMA13-2164 [hydrothermal vent metagenome]|uniref:Type I restriction modification DNA specificity domain-containing protein n=1 Tax=hydrothermal vent metagenome TaxID=652676 RepID=A0A3B0YM39_9ZZZZ